MGVITFQFKIVHMPFLLQSNLSIRATLGTEESGLVERWPLWGGGGQAYFVMP